MVITPNARFTMSRETIGARERVIADIKAIRVSLARHATPAKARANKEHRNLHQRINKYDNLANNR